MYFELGIIVEATMISLCPEKIRSHGSLYILLVQLPTDKALLVLIPHMIEQLVWPEECLVAKLKRLSVFRVWT